MTDENVALTQRPPLFVIGAGRLGSTLVRALTAASWPLAGVWSRSAPIEPAVCPTFLGPLPTRAIAAAPVVLFAVPDDVIGSLSDDVLTTSHIALHTSGATPASALRHGGRPHAAGAFHPLQSFSVRYGAPEHFRGIAFGLEGDDDAVAIGAALARTLGGSHFRLEDAYKKALYHAACCTVSNGLVALAHRAVDMFEAAGVSRPEAVAALAPLISGTASNLSSCATPEAVLTGPIARGDLEVIRSHFAALERLLPEALPPYKKLCDEISRTAGRPAVRWPTDAT